MVRSEPQDVSNLRIQQLRERLELYNATINGPMSTGATSSANDGAASLNKQLKGGVAGLDSAKPTGDHRSPLTAKASNSTFQKLPSATRFASQLKKTIDSSDGSASTSLKSATDFFAKEIKKPSPLKNPPNAGEKSPTEPAASAAKEPVDGGKGSKPASTAPPVAVASAKFPIPVSNISPGTTEAGKNKTSNADRTTLGYSASANDLAQRRTPPPSNLSSNPHKTSFVGGASPTRGSPPGRAPAVAAAFRASSPLWSRSATVQRLWGLPPTTSDATSTEGQHKNNEEDKSTEDSSTDNHDSGSSSSESSSSGEEKFSCFLDKTLATNPSVGQAVQGILSKTRGLLMRMDSKGTLEGGKAADKAKDGHPFTPSWVLGKRPCADPATGNGKAENATNERQGVAAAAAAAPSQSQGSFEGKGNAPTFAQRERAFQGLEAVVRAMRRVYRGNGLLLPAEEPDEKGKEKEIGGLPQAERAATLAAARDELVRQEAALRTQPPKGPSLEQTRATFAEPVEGLARQLLQDCEVAMEDFKDVEQRRCLLQENRRLLKMRREDLKERQEAHALITEELEQLRKQNNERAAALREREKKHLEKVALHRTKEKEIQEHISEVEQLGHKITSWLRILEERDATLSAKEEKLRRVQADLQRRVEDVKIYKELRNHIESNTSRRETVLE